MAMIKPMEKADEKNVPLRRAMILYWLFEYKGYTG
jgi:hypothetical protein